MLSTPDWIILGITAAIGAIGVVASGRVRAILFITLRHPFSPRPVEAFASDEANTMRHGGPTPPTPVGTAAGAGR